LTSQLVPTAGPVAVQATLVAAPSPTTALVRVTAHDAFAPVASASARTTDFIILILRKRKSWN